MPGCKTFHGQDDILILTVVATVTSCPPTLHHKLAAPKYQTKAILLREHMRKSCDVDENDRLVDICTMLPGACLVWFERTLTEQTSVSLAREKDPSDCVEQHSELK